LPKDGQCHAPHPHDGFGVYDHGYVLAYERIADHTPGDGRPKHRLWRIRTGMWSRRPAPSNGR
jgi:hypothetical protein